MIRTGVYPGSFDPITRGHEDLIHRSLAFVDLLIVAIATNVTKEPLFSVEERIIVHSASCVQANSIRKIQSGDASPSPSSRSSHPIEATRIRTSVPLRSRRWTRPPDSTTSRPSPADLCGESGNRAFMARLIP